MWMSQYQCGWCFNKDYDLTLSSPIVMFPLVSSWQRKICHSNAIVHMLLYNCCSLCDFTTVFISLSHMLLPVPVSCMYLFLGIIIPVPHTEFVVMLILVKRGKLGEVELRHTRGIAARVIAAVLTTHVVGNSAREQYTLSWFYCFPLETICDNVHSDKSKGYKISGSLILDLLETRVRQGLAINPILNCCQFHSACEWIKESFHCALLNLKEVKGTRGQVTAGLALVPEQAL